MFILGREARDDEKTTVNNSQSRSEPVTIANLRELLREIDVIGVLLLTLALAMTLIPLTLAGGQASKWREVGILTPLILGIILFLAFVFWESRTTKPLFPLYLLRNRSVWAGIGIGCLGPLAFTIHGNYLFTLLLVSYDFSIESATRIAPLYSFCSTLVGSLLAFVVLRIRRLKGLVIVGLTLWFVGGGLIYHYRGGIPSKVGLIGAEILIGSAAGFFSWPSFVLVQAATPHRYLSVAISLVFTANSLGQAFGNCVAGAIWTQTLYRILKDKLGDIDETLVAAVYASPLETVPDFAIGTPERDAIMESYRSIQRSLIIAAICFLVPAFVLAWFLHDPKLSDDQTQPEAKDEEHKVDRDAEKG